jgi:hypothetical protein
VLLPLIEPVAQGLALYPDVLAGVLPLSAKHRRLLPDGIRDLSQCLTSERSGLDPGYLRSAGARAAYLSFFLPWNLFRLSRLLPGLDLELRPGDRVADIGCGPLTLAQALWLARPDLREVELEFWCVDREKKLVTMGMDLLRALAEATGNGAPPWRVHLVHEPLEKGLGALPRGLRLVAAINVLNEVRFGRSAPLAEQLGELVERMAAPLAPGGTLLFVEPGTRLGGKLAALARESAVELGFAALAPCTHSKGCPMLAPRATSWCHFAMETFDAPAWLKALSRHAGLAKERAALSFAHLAAPADGEGGAAPADAPAEPGAQADEVGRVVSDAFPVPGRERGRYVCTPRGLAVVYGDPPGGGDPAGARALLLRPADAGRDAKSGLPVALWGAPDRMARGRAPSGGLGPRPGHAYGADVRQDDWRPGDDRPSEARDREGAHPAQGRGSSPQRSGQAGRERNGRGQGGRGPGGGKSGRPVSGKPDSGKPDPGKAGAGKPYPGKPDPGRPGPGASESGSSGKPGKPAAQRRKKPVGPKKGGPKGGPKTGPKKGGGGSGGGSGGGRA